MNLYVKKRLFGGSGHSVVISVNANLGVDVKARIDDNHN
jgi:hypothetical protein